ncbi:tyrosine-type recombinase/integrase [Bacillus sp. PR5]|nr:tyrosine-type recombinase/integrase [Bacillus sp. PR5]
MPKNALPPRLYLNKREGVWIIRDRSYAKRTGCLEHEREQAEKALAEYIALKHSNPVETKRADRIVIAQVLLTYSKERLPETVAPKSTAYALKALAPFWGRKVLSEIGKQTCSEFGTARMTGSRPVVQGTVRRDLSILHAAMMFWHENYGPLDTLPIVHMPPASPPRNRWLTKTEAALLLAGALGWRKTNGKWTRNRQSINRHLARMILLGIYTGSRLTVLLTVQWERNDRAGYIDLNEEIMYRKAEGERETKKRKPPVKLGRKILFHLKRWKRLDQAEQARIAAQAGTREQITFFNTVVHWHGFDIADIRHAWNRARDAAGLDAKVTPHILRHTRATWLMRAGVDIWEASHSLGMSTKTLEAVYGHHHASFQSKAAEV